MSAEQWRPVVGYEGVYEVSDRGRVRSVDRVVLHGGKPARRAGRIAAQYPDRDGYLRVRLYRDGGLCRARVARLVAEAFIPNPDRLPVVRHGFGGSQDNRVDNLSWGTAGDNERDKIAHGTSRFMPKGKCLRDHLLVAPNVSVRGGRKQCVACQRGRDRVRDAVRRGAALDLETVADQCYAEIMKEAA